MKKLALLAFALGFAGAANAQTANVSQTGDNQTATVTQSGSASNEAYVTQLADNTPTDGVQTSVVTQSGVSNYANVSMTQTGTGDVTANTASIIQSGNNNDMWQTIYAPTSNSGQHVTATQTGNTNRGVQSITSGHTENLTLSQSGHRNDSEQTTSGSFNFGEVYQLGNDNIARQTMMNTNEGYSTGRILIDQAGNGNQAYQLAAGGGSSDHNNATIEQSGNGNYANQTGNGRDLNLRLVQDGNSNWAFTNSVGNDAYMNVEMSDDAYLNASQTGGDRNSVFGMGGAGTAAQVTNGSSLTLTQTGSDNDAHINMTTGGSSTFSQIGSNNVGTVDQH